MSASGEKQTPKNRTYTVEDIAVILGIGKSSAGKLRRVPDDPDWKHDPHFQKIL